MYTIDREGRGESMLNILYNPKTSIFQRIETLIRTQGELPEDFEPEEREYGENELRFAPGAKEGIFGHHTAGSEGESSFAETLKEYLELEESEALKRFEEEEAAAFDTSSEYMPLLKYITEHTGEYDAGKVASLGYCFASKGTKCETVKLGLTLLALFNFSDNEKVCYLLKNLGYCEEFTTYVIINTSDWEEPKKQNLYFELAKKLKGWGKIDVVEKMTADTEEKKEWLLCHGCKNSIMNAYLAYECAVKCDLQARLEEGFLTEEQLQGASDIMEGLLDEGPCDGMSAMENPTELALSYLAELDRHVWNVHYANQVHDIFDYFFESDIEDSASVNVRALDIWGTLDGETMIKDELAENTYACLKLSRHYNLDMSEELLELMEQDFAKYYHYCYYLFQLNSMAEAFFKLCDKEIDASKYPQGMGDSLGLGKLGEGLFHLDMIVQYMGKYPLKGRKLLEISIQSPFTRWRNMAAKALRGWTERLKQPLAEIDAQLYDMVKNVYAQECNENTKEMWEKLL